MHNFISLLHSSVTHFQYENLLCEELGITKTKLSRIENNPGEIDKDLLEKISVLTKTSVHDLVRDYGCGIQVMSMAEAEALGLISLKQ